VIGTIVYELRLGRELFMSFELQRLNEQLTTLNIVYKDAIATNISIEERQKIEKQIENLQKLITERKELLKSNQSPN
jgi:hypothetical protein